MFHLRTIPNLEQHVRIFLKYSSFISAEERMDVTWLIWMQSHQYTWMQKCFITFFKISDVQALKNAYKLIKSATEGQTALDSSDNISTDLYVLCAEQALQVCNLGPLTVLNKNMYMMRCIYNCYSYYFKNLRSTWGKYYTVLVLESNCLNIHFPLKLHP